MKIVRKVLIKCTSEHLISAEKMEGPESVTSLRAAGRQCYSAIAGFDRNDQIEVLAGIRDAVNEALGGGALSAENPGKNESFRNIVASFAAGYLNEAIESGVSMEEVHGIGRTLAETLSYYSDLKSKPAAEMAM